jgi:hypothetical protein
VIQARQEEEESIQTRTFTNYNHSHTLTILYYEVLRHFKVEVEWVRRRPALLIEPKKPEQPDKAIDFKVIDFKNDDSVISYRHLIEPNLLDPSLKAGFDAIEKLQQEKEFYAKNDIRPPLLPFSEGDIAFDLFEFGIKTSGKTDELVTINVVIRNREDKKTQRIQLNFFKKLFEAEDRDANVGKRFNYADPMYSFFARTGEKQTIHWRDIIGFEFILHDDDEWTMDRIWINAFHLGGVVTLIENSPANFYFPLNGSSNSFTYIRRPSPDLPAPEKIKTAEQTLTANELHLTKKLKNHLSEFQAYYMRLVHLSKSPEQIAIEFEHKKWTDNSDLIDHVEPFPLEVFGSYVAYPLIEEGVITPQFIKDLFNEIHSNDLEQQKRAIGKLVDLNEQQLEQAATGFAMKKAKSEKLITLPTRGVFAEGKLGHCNISEEIDNTRYWKWEEHPIPFEAPGINPVTPVTPQPQQTNITPTTFPTSLVNIVNPSPAPDPTGLSDALKVLSAPNIFRDMSGRAEVADLLKKLSDNTIGFQEAANKAKEIINKHGESLDKQQKDFDLGVVNAAAGVESKLIDAENRRADAQAAKAEADAKKSTVEAATAQAEAAKNLPKSLREPVYKAASQALAGNPTKNKAVVFNPNFSPVIGSG